MPLTLALSSQSPHRIPSVRCKVLLKHFMISTDSPRPFRLFVPSTTLHLRASPGRLTKKYAESRRSWAIRAFAIIKLVRKHRQNALNLVNIVKINDNIMWQPASFEACSRFYLWQWPSSNYKFQ